MFNPEEINQSDSGCRGRVVTQQVFYKAQSTVVHGRRMQGSKANQEGVDEMGFESPVGLECDAISRSRIARDI